MWTRLNTYPKTLLFCLGCLSALAMAPVYAWWIMAVGYATLFHKLNQTVLFCFVRYNRRHIIFFICLE